MPCCGGKKAGKPIARLRYWIGLIMLACIHLALFLWLAVVAVFAPRYRPLVRPYRAYSREVLRSVLQKEGIELEEIIKH